MNLLKVSNICKTYERDETAVHALNSGRCSGILTRWINGGMKESAEEVSAFAEHLIAGIIAHL